MSSRNGVGIAVGWNHWLGFHRGFGNENRTWSSWEEFIEKNNNGKVGQEHQQRQKKGTGCA